MEAGVDHAFQQYRDEAVCLVFAAQAVFHNVCYTSHSASSLHLQRQAICHGLIGRIGYPSIASYTAVGRDVFDSFGERQDPSTEVFELTGYPMNYPMPYIIYRFPSSYYLHQPHTSKAGGL